MLCGSIKNSGATMGMEASDTSSLMPDLLNVQVFRVTKTIEERIGDHIHVLHGYESFGQTIWTHLEIWDAQDIALTADRCTGLAMKRRVMPGH